MLTHERTFGRHLILALCLIAAGCGGLPPKLDKPETPVEATKRRAQATRPAYNLSGYPPAVREGYIDGCETAKRTSLARKDPKRMSSDPQYSMGWNDGFALCKNK
jgi:hypothetical protein